MVSFNVLLKDISFCYIFYKTSDINCKNYLSKMLNNHILHDIFSDPNFSIVHFTTGSIQNTPYIIYRKNKQLLFASLHDFIFILKEFKKAYTFFTQKFTYLIN